MWLELRGRAGTGIEAFENGVTDTVVLETDAGTFVLAGTGRMGGVMAFRLGPEGDLSLTDSRLFTGSDALAASGKLALVDTGDGPMLIFGAGTDALLGYMIGADGSIGGRVGIPFDSARSEIAAGDDAMLRAWALHSDTGVAPVPDGSWHVGTVGFDVSGTGEAAHVVAIGGLDTHVTLMPRDGSGGITRFGASNGLGIAAPTALELVETAAGRWVILAAAESSSLSVLALDANGSLQATDHVIDTRNTRFGGVQALATAQRGDDVLVVAGGADHGLSLFLLSTEGRLIWLDTLEHGTDAGLYNISTLSAIVIDDDLIVTAGSQRDPGLSTVRVPLADLGVTGEIAAGGAGRDVLISSPDNATLSGGAGADVFVVRMQDTPVRITDFQPGLDRLDLSDWPMLRDVAQLGITTTERGATLSYRDYSIVIISENETALTAEDIFAHGFQGPDRVLILAEVSSGEEQPDDDASDPPPDDDPSPPLEDEPVEPGDGADDPGDDTPPPAESGPRVVDRFGQGLEGASVTFSTGTGSSYDTTTDAAGRFTLPSNPAGTLVLTRFHTAADPAIGVTDALDVLRLAVGLDDGVDPLDLIAADVNRDGEVTVTDALDLLRLAVGLDTDLSAEWVFIDSAADLSGVTARAVRYDSQIALTGADMAADLSITGILLGNLSDTA
ncbi:carboxypeptidase regulatory-like domain-containing protein [Aquicoccus sp.]|uniref:carboxypeptidase regulatory-like domain-containing protein n=1 Tax=Aquicoccus sp. TaxID=2055851 RepID=UPI003565214A